MSVPGAQRLDCIHPVKEQQCVSACTSQLALAGQHRNSSESACRVQFALLRFLCARAPYEKEHHLVISLSPAWVIGHRTKLRIVLSILGLLYEPSDDCTAGNEVSASALRFLRLMMKPPPAAASEP